VAHRTFRYNRHIMIQLTHVTKTFGEKIAVEDVSCEIEKGELYGLIGPNGAGKTTIIKMIMGLYRPNMGTMRIGEFDIGEEPQKVKKTLGYVPDEPFVYEKLTGREFLHFVGELYGMNQEERTKSIQNLLNIFSLHDVIDGLFENYSRGNKQKLSILAAILHQPQVLIIDEPVVGIDPQGIRKTKELLTRFVKDGGTVLLSTHTLSIAEEICTRIGFLKEGKLIEEGTISGLRRKAKKVQATLEELYFSLVT